MTDGSLRTGSGIGAGVGRSALGAVAPTIIRATTAEKFLEGRAATPENCAEAGRLAVEDARPISDMRASADGYTVLMGNAPTMGIAPSVYRDLAYDPVRHFAPVGRVTSLSMVLATSAALPVASVKISITG